LFLSDEKNHWLIPYITGKNFYDATGAPLTEGEYYEQIEKGSMRRKENNLVLENMNLLHKDAHWSVKK
jgi:hypothetical protein